ncbi:MAG: GH92 family glycosyl hydrolase [Flavobacteriales bacterium]
MRTILLFILVVSNSILAQNLDLTPFVNPFIGTQNAGHTFPGATVPFGSIQLSPDTDTIPMLKDGKYQKDVYRYCAGYQYQDSTIVGFSHTHFSGTGHSDLGDLLVVPIHGKIQWNPGTKDKPESGYRSRFNHKNESATPGHYAVFLDEPKTKVELTTTNRVGVHRYQFTEPADNFILLDLIHGIYQHPDKNVWCFVRVENDTLITGYRQTNGWARTRIVYFAISFSKPITSYQFRNEKPSSYNGFWRKFDQEHDFPEAAGEGIKGVFSFGNVSEVSMKVSLSSVSVDGALLNLKMECPHWDFDKYVHEAKTNWNERLNVIQAEFTSSEEKINFYTSMYHAMLGPTLFMDINGEYRGLDQRIHRADGFVNYTTFSLWDTYRAQHPFLNLVFPETNADMIQSMLAHYDQSVHHMLPVWSHYANENWCMIGYHSVSVIADAMVKGNRGFDYARALNAAVTTSNQRFYEGLGAYLDYKYVPEDLSGNSVSKTLEYAYDDWCIAQMAKHLNSDSIFSMYQKRSEYYQNQFDPIIGFMRPRLANGSFKKEFDVLSTHGQGFIEGNAWNYSLYVPQNPIKLISMMGGEKQFVEHLDSLFSMELPDRYFAETEDIMRDGIIGNYVHGNEPSHHVPYLYNFTSQPWKAQATTRMILPLQYKAKPDGLGGNDDCGQMSAWYIFTALGFYPVAPGSPNYSVTSPSVQHAILNLSNGNKFEIKVQHQSPKNIFIQSITLDGVPLKEPILTHDQLTKGGLLEVSLGPKPKKDLFQK